MTFISNKITICFSTERESSDSDVNASLNDTVLYNAMIYPFTRMVIKGAIWYQGM